MFLGRQCFSLHLAGMLGPRFSISLSGSRWQWYLVPLPDMKEVGADFILESTGFLELKIAFALKCPSKSVFCCVFNFLNFFLPLYYLMSLYKVFKHGPVWPVFLFLNTGQLSEWSVPVLLDYKLCLRSKKMFSDGHFLRVCPRFSTRLFQTQPKFCSRFFFLVKYCVVELELFNPWRSKVVLGRKRSKVPVGTKICNLYGEAVLW